MFSGVTPTELLVALQRGGFTELELTEVPLSVNVRVGGTEEEPELWHGVALDDLSSVITSVVEAKQVVPLLVFPSAKQVDLFSLFAAQNNIPKYIKVRQHAYQMAFALTDFKLQGRTIPKLILSLCNRTAAPHMTMTAFYVLISRVRTSDSLRLLQHHEDALEKIGKLKHAETLHAWEHGYDNHGVWQDALAVAALVELRTRWRNERATAIAAFKRARQERTQSNRVATQDARKVARAAATVERRAAAAQAKAERSATAVQVSVARPASAANHTGPSRKRRSRSTVDPHALPDLALPPRKRRARECSKCSSLEHERGECPLWTRNAGSSRPISRQQRALQRAGRK